MNEHKNVIRPLSSTELDLVSGATDDKNTPSIEDAEKQKSHARLGRNIKAASKDDKKPR